MNSRRRSSLVGFSLVEVMVASVLFLVSVAGVVSAISSASVTYEHQRRLTQAASIGEFKMEELLLRYSSHIDLAIAPTPRSVCLTPSLTTVACAPIEDGTRLIVGSDLGGNYLVWWNVSQSPVLGLRQIDLVVAWRESSGQRELPLMTYRR